MTRAAGVAKQVCHCSEAKAARALVLTQLLGASPMSETAQPKHVSSTAHPGPLTLQSPHRPFVCSLFSDYHLMQS